MVKDNKMIKSRNLRREVSTELVRRGYRRTDRMHMLPVLPDWKFWVDTGPLGKRADICPYVGVRYDSLEAAVSELLSLPLDETVGTLGANIGYVLTGNYRQWSEDSTSEEVLCAVDSAFALLRPLMDPHKLSEGWKMEAARDPLWRYREIALLVLQKDAVHAKARLELARTEYCRRDDSLAAQFRAFEERVLCRLG